MFSLHYFGKRLLVIGTCVYWTHECVDNVAMLVVVPDYTTNTVTPDTGHSGHTAHYTGHLVTTRGQCQYLGQFGEIFIGLLFVCLECQLVTSNSTSQLNGDQTIK